MYRSRTIDKMLGHCSLLLSVHVIHIRNIIHELNIIAINMEPQSVWKWSYLSLSINEKYTLSAPNFNPRRLKFGDERRQCFQFRKNTKIWMSNC